MSNREEVIAALEAIVAGHEDTVADCWYTNPYPDPDAVGEAAAPMCVVGHLIARLEPSVFQVIAEDYDANNTRIGGLEGYGVHVEFIKEDPDLLDALEIMQERQDSGDSWGTALAAFHKRLEPSNAH